MPHAARIGANCEATGHPAECTATAPGSLDSTSHCIVSVEGTDVGSHGTSDMHFPSHGHDTETDSEGNVSCVDYQTHDIDPDDTHIVRVEGTPVVFEGDSTTDPGSGGTASVVDAGGNSIVRES